MNLKTIPETKAENETENYLNTMKYRLKTKLKTRLEKVGKKTRLRRKTCDLFRRPLHFLSAQITFSEELARYGAENVAAREKKLEEENSLKALKSVSLRFNNFSSQNMLQFPKIRKDSKETTCCPTTWTSGVC